MKFCFSRQFLFLNGRRGATWFVVGVFATMLSTCTTALAAPITAGNLVLTRAAGGPNGDLTAALQGSGTAAQVFLDEYTTVGAFVQTIAVNSTLNTMAGSQRALTFSGTQNLEGHITLSGDGRYMTFAGYNQTATVAGTNSNPSGGDTATNAVERVIGRLELGTGTVDTSTALVDAVSNQSVRTAYSSDGTDLWVAGNGGNAITLNTVSTPTTGVHYAQLGASTSIQLNPTGLNANSRYVLGFNGNLYVSSGNTSNPNSPQKGINVMTGGLATTTGQTLSNLPGFMGSIANTPDDFWFKNGNTVYLADSTTNGTFVDAGIQKWVFNGGTNLWEHAYTINGGITNAAGTATGVHGLTGMINDQGQAVLFGTTIDGGGANQTKFFSVTDTGAASMAMILGTSALNSAFRGIEIAKLAPPVPEPGTLFLVALAGLTALSNVRRR